MSEQAKVRHADEAKKKIEVREKNCSVKIQKLERNNRYISLIDRDSNESDTDESLDSLRPVEILSMQTCSAALSFVSFLNSPSHPSVRILFVFLILQE